MKMSFLFYTVFLTLFAAVPLCATTHGAKQRRITIPTNQRDLDRELFGAIQTNNVEQVRAYLAAGANVNSVLYGTTPFFGAVQQGNTEMVKLLAPKAELDLAANDGSTVLHRAVIRGDVAMVQLLLAVGAGVDVVNVIGHTPLMVAIRTGHAKIAQELLEKGADVTISTTNGSTALFEAIVHVIKNNDAHMLEIIKLLLGKGADICVRVYGFNSLSPLKLLVLDNRKDLLAMAIEATPDALKADLKHRIYTLAKFHNIHSVVNDMNSLCRLTKAKIAALDLD